MTPAEATLVLARSRGLGPRRIKLLVTHFGSAQAVLAAEPEALTAVEGVGPGSLADLAAARSDDWPRKELARAERLGVRVLALEDAEYPESLRAIYDPPPVLYLRGELPETGALPRSVGVVGTRDASPYALALAKRLAADLAAAGVTVVSGLALGVDSAAHAGALGSAEGRTVAVLGSGVDVVYPRQNQALARQIWQGRGAVVSEQPLGSSPRPGNFPGRNRIITGLSRAVVVVEAGEKSGALITAEFALEEGRTVFAVPGRAGDPRAKGALALLKQGAVMVQEAADVLNEFGWRPAASQAGPELSAAQRALLETVARLGTPLLDDLLQATGQSASELLPQLTVLELEGLVQLEPGGRYSCVPLG